MSLNPYASPELVEDATTPITKDVPFREIARQIFLAWERLRVVYVVVLALFTLLMAGPSIVYTGVLVTIVEGAIIANLLFFAGPIVETYVNWLGYRGHWLRWFLFISGTLLSLLLALGAMFSILLPNQN